MSGLGEVTTDAFAAFVAEHGFALKRLAYLLTGRPGDAEDITQEALIRLYQAWPRIEAGGALAYARRIVVRKEPLARGSYTYVLFAPASPDETSLRTGFEEEGTLTRS